MNSQYVEIPAEDLTRQYQQIRMEIAPAIDRVLLSGKFTLGPILEEFEQEYAAYCGVRHCVGISNGTEALHLALKAMGIGPGDEVITQANTYVATAFAISYCGALPVFVDIEPEYFNMDVTKLEALINKNTRAIIPVHMYGHPVDMDPLMELARKHGLKVLEDASHAQGAIYKGRKTGSLGDAAAFSFYPSKVLGAYGDAGCVTTNDDELAQKLRVLRYMGQEEKHTHLVVGFQQRCDPVQASVLSVKLKHLDSWILERQRIAKTYDDQLVDLPIRLPKIANYATHVYYMYTILTDHRNTLSDFLLKKGIGSQKIYAIPVPMQPCYRDLKYSPKDIPVATKCAAELLCLPIFPELRQDEMEMISTAIHQFFKEINNG